MVKNRIIKNMSLKNINKNFVKFQIIVRFLIEKHKISIEIYFKFENLKLKFIKLHLEIENF